ncbi:MAG: hypothetical protein KAJ18_10510 [Candidatus Omnitrophica bacterium]|nr:hypothetical protein [Candidatus Omnitrophota bacterium]
MIKVKVLKNLFSSAKGITFVEVLLSVGILSVVIVGLIGTFVQCKILIGDVRDHSIVNNVLNERIEEIRGMDYATILSLGTTFTSVGFDQLDSATGALTLDDPFGDADIRRITLTVSWTSRQGRALSQSLAALFANEGINRM